jgi:hypothetical protein
MGNAKPAPRSIASAGGGATLMAFEIQSPFELFVDTDGTPLENGYVYIGEPSQNPETNPIAVYWDATATILAAQPIRTLAGFPMRNNSPSKLFAQQDFSITVRDKNGVFLYSEPSSLGGETIEALQDEWVNAQAATYVSGTSFTVPGDQTSGRFSFHVGRRVKAIGSSTGTIYGIVSTAVYGALTTVTVVWDSGSLSNEALIVYVSINSVLDTSIPWPFIDVRNFGAVGDGIVDDTAAIKKAAALLSSYSTLLFPAGTYRITSTELSPIDFAGSNIRIIGDGAILQNDSDRSFGTVIISGDHVTLEGFVFDGQNTSLNTLLVSDTASNVTIRNCEIKNCAQQAGDATFAVGILVQNGSEDVSVERCYIHTITASITGIARGILGSGYETASTHFYRLDVKDCWFEDITPDTDGDAIVFQPDDLTDDIHSSVINCRFVNCAKRAVKIQGNNVTVIGGHITLPATGYAGVSVYASRCQVRGITMSGGYALHGIDIGATGSSVGDQTTVDGVIVQMTSQSSNDGIRVYGAVDDVLISNCILDTLRNGVRLDGTGTRANILCNTIRNTTQVGVHNVGTAGSYMSQVNVIGNTFASITSFTVRNEGGTGWCAIGNTSDGSGTGSHGNLPTRSNFIGNIIASQPVIATGTTAPTAGTWAVGDIVIRSNPNTYGNMGWMCVTAGTPGSWRAIQTGSERASTASRPTKTTMGVANDSEWIGTMYFDTTLDADGKPIWWTGVAWVDATGAVV